MKRNPLLLIALLFIVSVVNMQCSSASKALSAGSPLLSALGAQPNLSSLTSLLQTPGLGKLLGGSLKKPFTLLAPTNDALNSLGADALSNLTKPENLSQLAGMLKDHIIPGKVDPAAIAGGGLKTAAGKALDLAGANLGSLLSSDKFNIIPVDKILK
jgi:uncharacterized surface protein with fasciclin (FAS1) repeats